MQFAKIYRVSPETLLLSTLHLQEEIRSLTLYFMSLYNLLYTLPPPMRLNKTLFVCNKMHDVYGII